MIPLVDVRRQNKIIKNEVKGAISKVMAKGDFILGSELEKFEKEFANYCQVKYAVGVASGTDALLLSLRAINIKKGDEVIIPANTFISSVLPVIYLKAKPVLVDVNPQTYNLDIKLIEQKINKKTKAILPVHLYGQPAEMDPILSLSKKYNLVVIEDACQAHGAVYRRKMIGGIGHLSCFSFYPGKNLGAFGDGGIVTTNNSKFSAKIRVLRNLGQKKKYFHVEKGYNSRLDTLQAAVLRVKLGYLDKWNKKRRKLAAYYSKFLTNLPVKLPFELSGTRANYHLYVIRVSKRNKLLHFLKTKEIYCGIHYPVPLHLQKCLRDLGYKKGDFPITEKYAKEILSLPMFPELKKREIEKIVGLIKKFYAN